MSDPLLTLITAKGSQESIHSTHATHSTTPPSPSSNVEAPTEPQSKLPVYDAKDYLNDPQNKALLQPAAAQPVQLGGPQTNYHIAAFNTLCQSKGIQPIFELDGSQFGFGGLLRIGDRVVTTDKTWSSKKAAKEALAKDGIEVVKIKEANRAPSAAAAGAPVNWIGILGGEYKLHFDRATLPRI